MGLSMDSKNIESCFGTHKLLNTEILIVILSNYCSYRLKMKQILIVFVIMLSAGRAAADIHFSASMNRMLRMVREHSLLYS